jgi:lipid-A-disaccharide synthase
MNRVQSSMAERATDLVIPIDYPGFNLRLARRAHAAGVPVLYYIAPQVWAWHRRRMADLAASADRLAVVFPFEEAIFRDAGAAVRFVGHPLTDRRPAVPDRESFVRDLGVGADAPLLALFPGSRAQEVKRHLRPFARAAKEVRRSRPDVEAVVAAAATVPPAAYADAGLPITTDSQALLSHATAALVKSGTTTVEAALAGTPMVVAYRAHPLTFWLARRLVRVDHVGMVNLIADRRVAPEFLQRHATPGALAEALLPLLDTTSPVRAAMLDALAEVRLALSREGEPSVAATVADMAAELLPGHA